MSTSECCGPIRRLREHSRPSFPHCCFFLLWVMERYIWTQVAPLSLLPHQVYPFACGSSIRLNGAYGSCFILQTCGGLIHAPQRPLHVVAQRVPPLLRQSACRTIWRLHHIQVEHPSYLSLLQLTKNYANFLSTLLLPPQYGHCGLHHRDIYSRAKNISSGHDPLCIRSRKSYWHKGESHSNLIYWIKF